MTIEQHEELEELEPEVEEIASPPPDAEPAEPSPEAPVQAEEDKELQWARNIARVLRSNPVLADDVVGIERGDKVAIDRELYDRIQQAQPPAQPEQSFDFYADPEAAFKTVAEKQARIEAHIYEQTRTQNKQALGTGIAGFRADHPELDDEQMAQVMGAVHDFGFLRPDSPFMARSRTRDEAVRNGFEAAYRLTSPERVMTPREQAVDLRSKRKAAAANVSPRSANRTQPTPTTQQERMSAAAAEFRAAERGG